MSKEKTQVINIKVPIDMIDMTPEQIREKLQSATSHLKYDGVSLKYSIRVPVNMGNRIREEAKRNKMTILEYTEALLNNEEVL